MQQFQTAHEFLAQAADNFGLAGIVTPELRKAMRKVLDKSGKWERKECPLKAPLVMWFVLGLMLFRHLSIANVRRRFLDFMRGKGSGFGLNAITSEAFMHARGRLGVEPVKLWFEWQVRELVLQPSFCGLQVFGIDGVRFKVFDNPANEKAFGRLRSQRGQAAFPHILGVVLTDNWGRQVRAAVPYHCKTSERAACPALLKYLTRGDICLMDRGFPSVWLFYSALQQGTHLLVRLPKTWKPIRLKENGAGDCLVGVVGPMNQVKGGPEVGLKLRMIEYEVNGSKFRLLTTLLDPTAYPAANLAQLYHTRWECELCYDELKNHLATVTTGTLKLQFRSKTPDGVHQEFYAMFIVYNLIRGLIIQAVQPRVNAELIAPEVQTLEVPATADVLHQPASESSVEPNSSRLATADPVTIAQDQDGAGAESHSEPPHHESNPTLALLVGAPAGEHCTATHEEPADGTGGNPILHTTEVEGVTLAQRDDQRQVVAQPGPRQLKALEVKETPATSHRTTKPATGLGNEAILRSPISISFVEALEVLRLALPRLQDAKPLRRAILYEQMLEDIAACALRPRRPRQYPRVVKIKMSNYKLKRRGHRQSKLDNEVHLLAA